MGTLFTTSSMIMVTSTGGADSHRYFALIAKGKIIIAPSTFRKFCKLFLIV